MKTLAWDSSGKSESVAILEDGKILGKSFHESVSSHSETLLDSIQSLLNQCQLSLEKMDLFALTVGPGSFTGLRIGISTAKAFARLYHKPIAPVFTLQALAQAQLESGKTVFACMDARLGELYVAAYHSEKSGLRCFIEPQVMNLSKLVEMGLQITGTKILVGSAIEQYPDLGEKMGGHWVEAPHAHFVDAVVVGLLGEALWKEGKTVMGEALQPQYLRRSEAENRLRKMEGKS